MRCCNRASAWLYISIVTLLLLCSFTLAFAAQTDPTSQDRSVTEFTTPDGRIDMDAVRHSGFQGNLSFEGMSVSFDPGTGEPLLTPEGNKSPTSDPDDIYWDESIGMGKTVIDASLLAMTVYDGNLVIGGDFTIAGVEANYIAEWDGLTWSTLGSGTDNTVFALEVYGDDLIVGGGFTSAGGVSANYIAVWDGASWSTLGSGTNGSVRDLAVCRRFRA